MSRVLPTPTLLKDYRPPTFLIDSIDLVFDLHETATRVTSTCQIRRNPQSDETPDVLLLNGEKIELVDLTLGGVRPRKEDWKVIEDTLEIRVPSDAFELQITTTIDPSANKALEGLYMTGGRFCTQCEAEGFRKITYYLDRPDVLAKFRVTLIADKTQYPVLLSNGNCIESRETKEGKHVSVWEDPFPKPCYLFALVAGNLGCISGQFKTLSGKSVALHIYVEHGKEARAEYALDSLIRAMQWEEEVYGLEYDLDIFNIVAVSDFNMGAMENKSLNIFNDKFILASTETATDTDYAWIESVVAHEYFHNWTGNRVTCRDWFQLSLKEGLTVFRDQQFSADQRSYSVQRINDVKRLRTAQFAEDASPLAHPVRPESYSEINNFYTHTVYEKGAEVVRMIHSIIGAKNFRKGMDIYFKRHDGQAVTCDDFVASMEAASGLNLSQFKLWYSQAGTPAIKAEGSYDPDTRTYELKLTQSCKATPEQPLKEAMHIPVAVGFVDKMNGSLIVNQRSKKDDSSATHLISLKDKVETITFDNFPHDVEHPIVTINRGFTAPVQVDMNYLPQELGTLVTHEPDPISRWDAAQQLARSALLQKVQGASSSQATDILLGSFGTVLGSALNDAGLTAQLLELPAESVISEGLNTFNPVDIFNSRRWLLELIGSKFVNDFVALYEKTNVSEASDTSGFQANIRALNHQALNYLLSGDCQKHAATALQQFKNSTTMTEQWSALLVLNQTQVESRRIALDEFAEKFSGDTLVMDKWFSLEATHPNENTLDRVENLKSHPKYDAQNPNKIRALITSFAMNNTIGFHQSSGHGYRFIADQIIEVDTFNPQSAARLAGAFQHWSRYDDLRSSLMHAELCRIAEISSLSSDVSEIVGKTLSADKH